MNIMLFCCHWRSSSSCSKQIKTKQIKQNMMQIILASFFWAYDHKLYKWQAANNLSPMRRTLSRVIQSTMAITDRVFLNHLFESIWWHSVQCVIIIIILLINQINMTEGQRSAWYLKRERNKSGHTNGCTIPFSQRRRATEKWWLHSFLFLISLNT